MEDCGYGSKLSQISTYMKVSGLQVPAAFALALTYNRNNRKNTNTMLTNNTLRIGRAITINATVAIAIIVTTAPPLAGLQTTHAQPPTETTAPTDPAPKSSWLAGVLLDAAKSTAAKAIPTPDQTPVEPVDSWITVANSEVMLVDNIIISTQESGILQSLSVERNSLTQAGEVVAAIDDKMAKLQIQAAELERQAALNRANDESDIRFSQAALEETRAELESYESLASRGNGAVSDAELRRKKLAVVRAEMALERSRQQQIQNQIAAKVHDSTVQITQERLTRFNITAPISGVVTEIFVKPGQWADVGKPILEISRLDLVQVDFFLNRDEVSFSSLIGRPIIVAVQRNDDRITELQGVIVSYDPKIYAENDVRVHAHVENRREGSAWLLLPGMNVSTKVSRNVIGEKTKIPTLPTQLDRTMAE